MCLYITRVTHVLYAIIECMLECSLCIRPTRNDLISVNRTFCPPDVREQDTNSQEGPLSARLKQQRTQTGSKMSYRDLNLRPPIIWWTQGSTKKKYLHLPLFRTSDPGSHSGPSSPLPTAVHAFIFVGWKSTTLLSWSSSVKLRVRTLRIMCFLRSTFQ